MSITESKNNGRGEVFAPTSLKALIRTVTMLVKDQPWSEGGKKRDIPVYNLFGTDEITGRKMHY